LARVEEASFEKDGKPVNYRKAALTREGEQTVEGAPLDLSLRERTMRSPAKREKAAKLREAIPVTLSAEAAALEQRLREWRLGIARKEGKPAFFVFGDSVLRSIAHARPRTISALAAIHGIGAAKLERFGADVCRICSED
jgi:superfamily II DNA helicase RecQ